MTAGKLTRLRLPSVVIGVAALTGIVLVGPAASAGTEGLNDAPPTVTSEGCGDGFSALTVTPAPGFDPTTATAEQLQANNFPPRPADPADTEAMTAWTSYVTGPIDRTSTCADLIKSDSTSVPQATAAATTRVNTANWSGNVANDRRFVDADASWVLPTDRDTDHVARHSSQWVGIGGTTGQNGSRLIQAGTAADVTNGVTKYCLFIEDAQLTGRRCLQNVVHPGDHIYVHVHEVSGTGSFHVVDTQARIDRTFTIDDPAVGANAESAEWILERPLVGGRFPELAHTDPVTFTGARGAGPGSGFTGLSSLGHYFIVMQTCDTLIQLAHPGPINSSNNSFQGIWDAHGHADPRNCP
jgi:Peptidase A4 family